MPPPATTWASDQEANGSSIFTDGVVVGIDRCDREIQRADLKRGIPPTIDLRFAGNVLDISVYLYQAKHSLNSQSIMFRVDIFAQSWALSVGLLPTSQAVVIAHHSEAIASTATLHRLSLSRVENRMNCNYTQLDHASPVLKSPFHQRQASVVYRRRGRCLPAV